MQEVTAIIRLNMLQRTKEALAEKGFYAMHAMKVLGRGKQKGLSYELTGEAQEAHGKMRYVPKRMLSMVVSSSQVDEVVRTIIEVNQTGHIGDGKIFISPVENAIRVRTGEEGEAAI